MKYCVDKALEVLEQTPRTLNSFLKNLSDEWIYCHEGNKTWSAFDVLGHLIHGEETDWIPRLKIIINDSSHKTFESFDRFAQFKNSDGKTIHQLLDEFSKLRRQNLDYLKTLKLTEKDFKKQAIHPELGKVNLSHLLASWVTHDLGHIAQIARVLAKQYKNEVGPWQDYISILNS